MAISWVACVIVKRLAYDEDWARRVFSDPAGPRFARVAKLEGETEVGHQLGVEGIGAVKITDTYENMGDHVGVRSGCEP